MWSAIVLVVLIVAVGQYLRHRNERGRHLQDHEGQTQREVELEEEVQQLRERVKVLERIATDPARRTAEEIEKLRDE